jgi:hypothetical protein
LHRQVLLERKDSSAHLILLAVDVFRHFGCDTGSSTQVWHLTPKYGCSKAKLLYVSLMDNNHHYAERTILAFSSSRQTLRARFLSGHRSLFRQFLQVILHVM